MAIVWPVTNLSLPTGRDKAGAMLIALRDALVGSGLWEVSGSGDGRALFQNKGQTAGIAGKFDVFTASPAYYIGADANFAGAAAGTISALNAWLQIKEIGSTRTLQIGRHYGNGYTAVLSFKWCPDGVQASGASPTRWPNHTGSAQFLNNDFKEPPVYSGGNLFGEALSASNAYEAIVHIGTSDVARSKGVCPFFLLVINRSTSEPNAALIYESLTDSHELNMHPYLLRTSVNSTSKSPWWRAVGQVGAAAYGPFFGGNDLTAEMGITGSPVTRVNCAAHAVTGGPTLPGAAFAPPQPDGRWRTHHLRAFTTAGLYLGRTEHLLANLQNRDYPTTYDVAGSSPRITAGHLLLPWQQNTVPILGL